MAGTKTTEPNSTLQVQVDWGNNPSCSLGRSALGEKGKRGKGEKGSAWGKAFSQDDGEVQVIGKTGDLYSWRDSGRQNHSSFDLVLADSPAPSRSSATSTSVCTSVNYCLFLFPSNNIFTPLSKTDKHLFFKSSKWLSEFSLIHNLFLWWFTLFNNLFLWF